MSRGIKAMRSSTLRELLPVNTLLRKLSKALPSLEAAAFEKSI
jgi:hypothetical protein